MRPAAARLGGVLHWLVFLGALWFIAAFVYVAASSLRYPFHLEWMEGQGIDVVQRILEGKPLYVKPSLEYVPFLYTPLYFYVSAAVAWFTGVDFFAGRLVSFLSALGAGGVLYAWIRREGGAWRHGVIAAGLYFSTYCLSARWFDVARIDSLFLLLTLAGLYVFYFYRHPRGALGAALLLAAAFFTKQLALPMVIPALLAGLALDAKHAARALAWLALFIGGGVALAEAASGGWFSFYVFTVPAGHNLDRRHIYAFWTDSMLRQTGIIFTLALALVAYYGRACRPKALWYAALLIGFVGSSYAARLHWGGWLNVLMPAHAVLALLAGLSFVVSRNATIPSLVSHALILAQMAQLLYNPLPFIPTQVSIERGNQFLKEIAAIEGDIFATELQFVQTRAGKKSYSFGMAGFDVLRADLGKKNHVKHELARELREAVIHRRFGAIFDGRLIRVPALRGNYRFSRRIPYPKEYVAQAINFFRGDMFIPIPKPVPKR